MNLNRLLLFSRYLTLDDLPLSHTITKRTLFHNFNFERMALAATSSSKVISGSGFPLSSLSSEIKGEIMFVLSVFVYSVLEVFLEAEIDSCWYLFFFVSVFVQFHKLVRSGYLTGRTWHPRLCLSGGVW